MYQSGITTDNKPVFADVFRLVGTYGIPLELILYRFDREGFVVDWVHYITCALKDGHKPHTIKCRILEAIGDVYGKDYRYNVEFRLNCLLKFGS